MILFLWLGVVLPTTHRGAMLLLWCPVFPNGLLGGDGLGQEFSDQMLHFVNVTYVVYVVLFVV